MCFMLCGVIDEMRMKIQTHHATIDEMKNKSTHPLSLITTNPPPSPITHTTRCLPL